jgi:hypothetical protein
VVERPLEMLVETLVFGKTRTRLRTALPGYEGEWLEPEDVEEYLGDKGLFFGIHEGNVEVVVPETTLKEVGIDVPGPMAGAGSTSWTSEFTTQYPTEGLLQQPSLSHCLTESETNGTSIFPVIDNMHVVPENMYDTKGWSSFDFDNTSSVPSQMSMNQLWAASEATSAFISTTLNLQSLIETLALNAVCIGPGPGNRSGDINNALRMAIAGY